MACQGPLVFGPQASEPLAPVGAAARCFSTTGLPVLTRQLAMKKKIEEVERMLFAPKPRRKHRHAGEGDALEPLTEGGIDEEEDELDEEEWSEEGESTPTVSLQPPPGAAIPAETGEHLPTPALRPRYLCPTRSVAPLPPQRSRGWKGRSPVPSGGRLLDPQAHERLPKTRRWMPAPRRADGRPPPGTEWKAPGRPQAGPCSGTALPTSHVSWYRPCTNRGTARRASRGALRGSGWRHRGRPARPRRRPLPRA